MRVLCIDIEGGHGGSSRSLYQLLTQLDPEAVSVEVICRQNGWVVDAYQKRGISCCVEPDMPRWTNLARNSRNAITLGIFHAWVWPKSKAFRTRLLATLDGVNLLHLNHISLAHLARWIKRHRPDLPIVMHIRTLPVLTAFATFQSRIAAAACDSFVFITENERNHFESLLGQPAPGRVLFNPVKAIGIQDAVDSSGPLRVACLSNYSHMRGIDRLLDIAICLSKMDQARVRFLVAGDMKLVKPIPAHLLESAQDATEFSEIVTAHGLSSYFEFLGHISDPERVLMESHVLIKPTRENNPWGRDILEAMAAGLPVVSVGTYSRFVEKDVTGLLQSRFDAKGVACFLMHLLANPDRRAGMGVSARDRVASLCDPTKHAEMLTELWTNVSTGNVVPPISRIRFGAVMPAYSAGGSELVLTSLVSGLDAEEFETRLFVISDAGRLNVDLSKIGFVHTLGIARLRNALFPLWRMLRGFRREVVFSSQVHLNICVLALGRLIPGMKIVVREANMPSDCLRNGHWPCLYRPLYRWALRRANCVMASSEMMRADMVKTFGVPDSKLMVLYNPVDVNDLRLRAKTPKRHPGPGRRFVAVGRLVRQKGFDRAIEWMAQMPSEDHLTILGEGEARDVLAMEIAQKKLQDRITLVGFVESPAAWVAGADALIMTSRWEGMPNAALEALAVGTPVIATPESGAIVEVASMASSGTVCVASDFCAAMRAVEVKPCSHPRPSLLPDAFSVGEVTDSFKRVLKTLCSNPTRPGV